jgi:hypothetical protein
LKRHQQFQWADPAVYFHRVNSKGEEFGLPSV